MKIGQKETVRWRQCALLIVSSLLLQSCLKNADAGLGDVARLKPQADQITPTSATHPCFEGTDISGDAVNSPLSVSEDRSIFEFLGARLSLVGDKSLAIYNLRTKKGENIPITVQEPGGGSIYYPPVPAGIDFPTKTVGRCFVSVAFGRQFSAYWWPRIGIWIRDDGKHGFISTKGDKPIDLPEPSFFSYSKFFGYRGQIYFLQLNPGDIDHDVDFVRTNGESTEIIAEKINCWSRFSKTVDGFLIGMFTSFDGCRSGDPGKIYHPDSNSWTSFVWP